MLFAFSLNSYSCCCLRFRFTWRGSWSKHSLRPYSSRVVIFFFHQDTSLVGNLSNSRNPWRSSGWQARRLRLPEHFGKSKPGTVAGPHFRNFSAPNCCEWKTLGGCFDKIPSVTRDYNILKEMRFSFMSRTDLWIFEC